METQTIFYDSKAVAEDLLKGLGDAVTAKEGSKEYEKLVPQLQNLLDTGLAEFNKKHTDLVSVYDQLVQDSNATYASYDGQIANLQKEAKNQKEAHDAEVKSIIALYKQQRDEITKQADKERGEMDRQKKELEQSKIEAEEEIEKYKEMIQEAQEDKELSFKALEEEKAKREERDEDFKSLEKDHEELKREVKNWEEENRQTTNYYEDAKKQRDTARAALAPTKAENERLTREVGQVKAELMKAEKIMEKQTEKIKKLKDELAATAERLQNETKSRESTPRANIADSPAYELKDLEQVETPLATPLETPLKTPLETPLKTPGETPLKTPGETTRTGSPSFRRAAMRSVTFSENRAEKEQYEKKVADLEAERNKLQNDSANCQKALKKLQDEVSKKDNDRVKELKAKIGDLEKQLKASEAGANKHKSDIIKLNDQIEDLKLELKAAKDSDANKSAESTGFEEELQATKQELRDVKEQLDAHLKLLSQAEDARDKLQEEYQALETTLEQRNVAQDLLNKELHKAENARASMYRTVQRVLEPDVNIADLQDLSGQVLDLVKLRQRTFNMQEKLIPLTVKAAADYTNITGRGVVIHGHDTTDQGRHYISMPDMFVNDIRDLYNRFTTRIQEAQADVDKLKESTKGENTAAQETINNMQTQINTLQNQNKDLERMLKTSQENASRYETDEANQSRPIKDIRALVRKFLAIAGPSIKDLDDLLVNLVKLQKTVPGAIPFGEDIERKAGQLEETRKQLDECKAERTRLQDRNRIIKKNQDDSNQERKRLQSELARVTAELKAIRDSHPQDGDKARKLEETIGRLSAEIQTLKDESKEERSRHAEEVDDLNNQLRGVRERLEQQRTDSALQVRRVEGENKALQASSDEEIARLGNENTRLTGVLQNTKDSCERQRKLLQDEVSRLNKQLEYFRKMGEQDRAAHMAQVTRLNGELDTLRTNSQEETARLAQEVTRLEQENARLAKEVARLNAELQALRDTLGEQINVIGGNGQQANRTQEALSAQIAIFTEAQRQLIQSIDNMNKQATDQGRSAALAQRSLRRARDEVQMFKGLLQQLTVERDLLQDEVRRCQEAERKGRQRLRAPAPAPDPAPAPGAAGAAAAAAGDAVVGTANFLGRTYDLLLTTIRYGTVWGTLGAVFVMMVVVIIAEGRQYAEWQHANAHSRALWMAMRDRPTVCLGPPNIDYFWHTLAVLLSGRWTFR